MPEICDASTSFKTAAFLLVLLWEHWLGRTTRVRSNSSIELIATIAAAIIARLMRRK